MSFSQEVNTTAADRRRKKIFFIVKRFNACPTYAVQAGLIVILIDRTKMAVGRKKSKAG